MCEWIEVSTSGYYEWRDRPASATARRREYLKTLITAIVEQSDRTYGYRRVHAQLARHGEQASPEFVRELMRELDLVSCQPRPYRPTTTSPGDPGPIPDLVNRDFTASAPGQNMVGDITYIPTRGRLVVSRYRHRLLPPKAASDTPWPIISVLNW
jgi:transposase InsO family protein